MKCVFCDSEAYSDSWNKQWFVRCNDGKCGAIGPWGKTQREAESKWNAASAGKPRSGLKAVETGGFVVGDVVAAAERLEKKTR